MYCVCMCVPILSMHSYQIFCLGTRPFTPEGREGRHNTMIMHFQFQWSPLIACVVGKVGRALVTQQISMFHSKDSCYANAVRLTCCAKNALHVHMYSALCDWRSFDWNIMYCINRDLTSIIYDDTSDSIVLLTFPIYSESLLSTVH